MPSGKNAYHIIDEPKIRAAEHLIVNPLVILLASILIPIFWSPPYLGRFWLPFFWLCLNGYLLGSPTLLKEALISLGSIVSLAAVFFILVFVPAGLGLIDKPELIYPYIQLSLMAVFFIGMYIVVFIQTIPWSIYNYIAQGAAQ